MARRVVTYLSDEQYKVFLSVVEASGFDEAKLVRYALREFMADLEITQGRVWPTDDPEHGGKREGAGYPKGRPRKSGGRKKKIAT